MGQQQTMQKCNFEDVQYFIKDNNTNKILINTLPDTEQRCLIQKTIVSSVEEKIINDALYNNLNIHIIIYGKNSNDQSIYDKYKKLYDLGFHNVYLYIGGMFEWLCLQDIYGEEMFPTTNKELDILFYKPKQFFVNNLLHNY